MKRALITGVTGQDGSYLTELLLDKGYEVHGIVRRTSAMNRQHLDEIVAARPGAALHLHYGDLTDAAAMFDITEATQPDEIYNLAAQSQVRVSFDTPVYTADVVGMGALHVLEAARRLNRTRPVRFYQASTSEMFGGLPHTAPQNEQTPFHPRSPYGCAKAFAHHCAVNYRESYDLFTSCGILFNHESPRRGENFVTRKITIGAARIARGLQEKIALGNLNSVRDWGYARDYVHAMWLMLQQNEPGDYVIATGRIHTVRDFLQIAFERVNLNWKEHIEVDPRFYRPAEVHLLQGDPTLAREQLGWRPETSFTDLVHLMVDADLELIDRAQTP